MDQAIGHFLGVMSASAAAACEWLIEVDRRQQFLADGARDLAQWAFGPVRVRHSTAFQLVGVARDFRICPCSVRSSRKELSPLDQVDAISSLATPDLEAALIEETMGLSNAALGRAGVTPPAPVRMSGRLGSRVG
jgi:hypothetical protein